MIERMLVSEDQLREEFDEIARLSGAHESEDRYDSFLMSQIPLQARSVLDVGCGMGRFTKCLNGSDRQVVGIDLSPEMIARAKNLEEDEGKLTFCCGNFLNMEFPHSSFDSLISVAALHHMPLESAVRRMVELVRPGGTLIIHDLRSDSNVLERISTYFAGLLNCLRRFRRTGRFFAERELRQAWIKHGSSETYLTMNEVRALASSLAPAARAYKHWFWKYTIVWQKPQSCSERSE
jgi:2-polyprenyl-3-methyl-5-hydroxy-6-metoxy-1,4-benzoquinol methylase